MYVFIGIGCFVGMKRKRGTNIIQVSISVIKLFFFVTHAAAK